VVKSHTRPGAAAFSFSDAPDAAEYILQQLLPVDLTAGGWQMVGSLLCCLPDVLLVLLDC
jgi:hypothetical protein